MIVYILLFLGFALLIKGADYLVKGASSLAKILKVSDLIIGLTIVSFGTSMPEFVVNIFASFQGNADIAIGNIIGSNIFNILVILGISSIILPLVVTKRTVWIEIPITLLAALMLGLLANSHIVTKSSVSWFIKNRRHNIADIFSAVSCITYSTSRKKKRTRS